MALRCPDECGATRGSRRQRPVQALDERGDARLNVVALATVLCAGWFLYIALGLGSVTAIDLELRILAGGVGAALAIAAVLVFLRRREDLVAATLGAFTAASFALGVAQMTQPDAAWRVLFPAALFGGLLFGFLAFRGAFRKS
jgi:hypothetical protein